jgi:hypothetical protein
MTPQPNHKRSRNRSSSLPGLYFPGKCDGLNTSVQHRRQSFQNQTRWKIGRLGLTVSPMSPTRKASRLTLIIAVVTGALFIAGFLPTPYLASPRWEVWVVAEDSKPLPGINVRLVYENYSAENQSHEITMKTDESGHVLFPPEFQSASLFRRVFHTASSARAGVHASFGRHAYVFAFGGGYDGDVVSGNYITDWHGSPGTMESRIVAKKRAN